MKKENFRSFASDNNSGIHPDIFKALEKANRDHALGYGDDPWTSAAIEKFQEVFGGGVKVAFVFNGTGANVTALGSVARSFEAVICSDCSHIQTDECGAPEKFTGMKLLAVPHRNGKLELPAVEKTYRGIGEVHHVQPKILSLTQSTEMGTVYSIEEVQSLAAFAHARGMIVHMDGARIANAAASLGISLRAATREAGVDVLSFGGTKNGMMMGEAVIFFRPELGEVFPFYRKQGMQLASKMRFLSAQFGALLTDDLWLRNARHANRMAQLLAEHARAIPGLRITRPVQANAVFAMLPREAIARLQAESFFYIWEEGESECEVRWMTTFDTTEADIDAFRQRLVRELTGSLVEQ
jgi:threonine aldolase